MWYPFKKYKCSKCGRKKWPKEFTRDRKNTHRDGLTYWCRACAKRYYEDWKAGKNTKKKPRRAARVATVAMQTCKACGKAKPYTEYRYIPHRISGGGHHLHTCSKCITEKAKETRTRNRGGDGAACEERQPWAGYPEDYRVAYWKYVKGETGLNTLMYELVDLGADPNAVHELIIALGASYYTHLDEETDPKADGGDGRWAPRT